MKKQSKSLTFQIRWKLLWETLQASVFKIFAIYSMLPIWYGGEFMPGWMRGQKDAIKWVFHLGSWPHCPETVVWSTKITGLHYLLRVWILNRMLNTGLQGGKANALIALCQPLPPEDSEVPYTFDYYSVRTHIQPYRHKWYSWDKTKPFQSYNSCCGYIVVSLWQEVQKSYLRFHRNREP